MRVVQKPEALELLEQNRRELLRKADECVMCAIARYTSRNPEWLGQTEHAVVALSRFGMRRGHLMILSKACVNRTSELGFSAFENLTRLLYGASLAVERALSPKRTFLASLGATAQLPMTSPHFHFHVMPLYETGESTRPANVFSWSQGVVVYDSDQEVGELRDELQRAWPQRQVPLDLG